MKRYIYFLRPVGQLGPIKIGCSNDVERRLKTYCSWSPVRLEVIVSVPGSFDLERKLHELFASAHSHLEWFHPVHELLVGVEALKVGQPIDRAFDLTRKTGTIAQLKRPRIMERFTPQYRQRLSYNHSFVKRQQKLREVAGVHWRLSPLASDVMNREHNQEPLTADQIRALDCELQAITEQIYSRASRP